MMSLKEPLSVVVNPAKQARLSPPRKYRTDRPDSERRGLGKPVDECHRIVVKRKTGPAVWVSKHRPVSSASAEKPRKIGILRGSEFCSGIRVVSTILRGSSDAYRQCGKRDSVIRSATRRRSHNPGHRSGSLAEGPHKTGRDLPMKDYLLRFFTWW